MKYSIESVDPQPSTGPHENTTNILLQSLPLPVTTTPSECIRSGIHRCRMEDLCGKMSGCWNCGLSAWQSQKPCSCSASLTNRRCQTSLNLWYMCAKRTRGSSSHWLTSSNTGGSPVFIFMGIWIGSGIAILDGGRCFSRSRKQLPT